MPEIVQRDPEETAATIARWLATKLAPGADPQVSEVEAPAATGFSNETILCRARWLDDTNGRDTVRPERRLVLRIAPTRHTLFLDAQFSTQYRVMRALHDAGSQVLVPPLRWYEEDTSWFGVPFFVMDHVEGVVPGEPTYDNPWLMEASAAQQERMWWTGLESLAAVHRVDWRRLDLGWLDDTARGTPGIGQQMAYYRDFLDWTAGGRPQPVAEATWQWLVDHTPDEPGDLVLCWGDSRMGNIIWEDFRPRAVLDWEMATLAQPELDLGWWLYFDRQFSVGLPEPKPRPAGFPSREATIERFSALVGRPLGDVFFYEVFSGFRFAVIMVRLSDLLVESGLLPAESDMGFNNIATDLLRQMLDLAES